MIVRQLDAALAVLPERAPGFLLAYEPVWAIGTGETATPADAAAAHGTLRNRLTEALGPDRAEGVPILYGGSVNPSNVAELLAARMWTECWSGVRASTRSRSPRSPKPLNVRVFGLTPGVARATFIRCSPPSRLDEYVRFTACGVDPQRDSPLCRRPPPIGEGRRSGGDGWRRRGHGWDSGWSAGHDRVDSCHVDHRLRIHGVGARAVHHVVSGTAARVDSSSRCSANGSGGPADSPLAQSERGSAGRPGRGRRSAWRRRKQQLTRSGLSTDAGRPAGPATRVSNVLI